MEEEKQKQNIGKTKSSFDRVEEDSEETLFVIFSFKGTLPPKNYYYYYYNFPPFLCVRSVML